MIVKSFFAGFGGQGVISMGITLSYAAMLDDKYTTCFPSYGAEVRGGTANVTVAVGDEDIASPVASEPEYIVAMNSPSMVRFENFLASGGIMFLNSSLITDRPTRDNIQIVEIPANEIAQEVASERSANYVMMGALSNHFGLLNVEAFHRAIEMMYGNKKKVADANLKAFEAGRELNGK